MTAVINGRERKFPVLPSTDLRSYEHMVSGKVAFPVGLPPRDAVKILDRGTIRLDQGSSSACALFSAGNTWKPAGGKPSNLQCTLWYIDAQKLDEWPGENYEGTSVNAAMKELRKQGHISAWQWCRSPEDVIAAVLAGRAVEWPATWSTGMTYPDRSAIMSTAGAPIGGHAVAVIGWIGPWSLLVIENSWSRWGADGVAYLSFENFARKWEEWPEAAIPIYK